MRKKNDCVPESLVDTGKISQELIHTVSTCIQHLALLKCIIEMILSYRTFICTDKVLKH